MPAIQPARYVPSSGELIDQAAQCLARNRSDFMLEAACDKAQSVLLLNPRYFSVLPMPRNSAISPSCLDAPPARNPGA